MCVHIFKYKVDAAADDDDWGAEGWIRSDRRMMDKLTNRNVDTDKAFIDRM